MKHGMTIRLASVALAVLTAAPAVAGPERVEREEARTVDATGKHQLTVKNARGRTVVVGKPGLESVSIVAVKVANGHDRDESERLLDRLEIRTESDGDEIHVETREEGSRSRGLWSFVRGDRRSAWVDYTIEVPGHFSVEASASSGEVRVSNIEGDCVAEATSGDLALRAIGKSAEVAVTSGDAEIVDIGGDLDASTTSGTMKIDNVRGGLSVSATSGDVDVTRVGGDVDAAVTSGNFTLEGCEGDVKFSAASGDGRIMEVTGSVEAASSSGDLEIMIIPTVDRAFALTSSSGDIDVYYVAVQEYGFQLDIQTASGSIEGDLPIRVSRVDRRRLQGVVGSGSARVDIETASGDIRILERSESATR
jgi:hypothetical protein